MTGIYIHIPFCVKKCNYCNFCSIKYDEALAHRYVQALCSSFRIYEGEPCDSVYIGGGTPSILSPADLDFLFSGIRSHLVLSDSAEITVEANPATLTEEKLDVMQKSGVNRFSLGVQSLDDYSLKRLGRIHSSAEAIESLDMIKRYFDNLSCDLMIGLPWVESEFERFCADADTLIAHGAKHISVYILKIEDGTIFGKAGLQLKNDDYIADLYLKTSQYLESKGMKHYEISNFAYENRESRHNMKYWTLEPYLGFGASAHSFYGGQRFKCSDNVEEFISEPCKQIVTDSCPDELEEYVMLGLRTSRGISLSQCGELAESMRRVALKLTKSGLAVLDGDTLRLTDSGYLVSNSIISTLLWN